MTREELIDKIAQSLCDSADERTLLQVYYDNNYSWLESMSKEELLEEALCTLGDKVEIDE